MGDCCGSMLKYVIFLCNFVIFVSGSVVFGFGVAAHVKANELDEFAQGTLFHSSIVLMAAGGIIMLVTFFGCCGVCTESPCMLYVYGSLLALILILEIGGAVAAIVLKDPAQQAVKDAMNSNLQSYKVDEGTTKAWDEMQSNLFCCGISSYEDWKNVTSIAQDSVPDSCCINRVYGCGTGAVLKPDGHIHQNGCFEKVKGIISDNIVIVGAVAAAVIVLQILGICVVCCLANRMREQKQYV